MMEFNQKLHARKMGSGIGANLSVIINLMKRETLILMQYKMDIVYWIIVPILQLIPFIFFANSVISGNLDNFERLAGTKDYIGFLFIGTMLWATSDAAIWSIGNALRWEREAGTLDFLWVSPVSRSDLLVGVAMGQVTWVFLNVTGQFIIISIVLQWTYDIVDLLITFLAVIVLVLGMFGFGFVYASIVVQFRDPGALSEIVDQMLYLASPISYPYKGMPVILRMVATILPFTWGVAIIRNVLIATGDIPSIILYFCYMILADIGFWVVGYFLFQIVERKSRTMGTLSVF